MRLILIFALWASLTAILDARSVAARPPAACSDKSSWCPIITGVQCYTGHDICCATCQQFIVSPPIEGCEYGDRATWCPTYVRSADDCRRTEIAHYCCHSCARYLTTQPTTTTVITFDDARTPQSPTAYTTGQLICRVSGNPNPTVYWRYRGQRLVTGDRYSQVHYGLLIRNITEADNGIYTCCAEVQSTGALSQRDIEVIVYYPPVITEGPGDVSRIQSQEYTLKCKARGVPDPKYEFFKDNNEAPVFSTGNHEFEDRLQVDGDEGVIHFRPLIKEDEGVYTCHAFSEAGEDFATGHLRVLIPPTVYNIKNMTQSEGLSTTLVCLSWGDPAPEMTYRKEGHTEDYVLGSNEDGRIVLRNDVGGRLDMTISNLVPGDMANYTCKSRNIGYHELNGSIYVNCGAEENTVQQTLTTAAPPVEQTSTCSNTRRSSVLELFLGTAAEHK